MIKKVKIVKYWTYSTFETINRYCYDALSTDTNHREYKFEPHSDSTNDIVNHSARIKVRHALFGDLFGDPFGDKSNYCQLVE